MNKVEVGIVAAAVFGSVACARTTKQGPSVETTRAVPAEAARATPAETTHAVPAETTRAVVDAGRNAAAPAHARVSTGKYVGPSGRMMTIYGACSPENFLTREGGEAVARGGLGEDGRTLRTVEGDVCGAYRIEPTANAGTVSLKWKRDLAASAHRNPDVIKVCEAAEGRFDLMQSGISEPAPGKYVREGGGALTVLYEGCAVESFLSLSGDTTAKGVLAPKKTAIGYVPFLPVPEGNVCGGYAFVERARGVLSVRWAPPEDASIRRDPAVAKNCKTAEGTYLRTE